MAQGQVETATSGLAGGTPRDNRYGARGELIIGGDPANPLPVRSYGTGEYEAVVASDTDEVLGATGAIGDYLAGLLVQPGTTSPGTVVLKDGANTVYTFPGGASSVASLVPFFVPIGAVSKVGAWNVTTGANVTVFATGDFAT